MSSIHVPQTQCVHIFKGEFEQLKKYQTEPIENGLCCYLYGLWTHSSNVVVQLVVSNQTEYEYAKTHQLNCVGYVAKRYSADLYDTVKSQTKLSSRRQHIIVDVSETERTNSLRAFASHSKSEDPLNQGQVLQVNMLPNESPFRKELYRMNPEMKVVINGYKSESENDLTSHLTEVNHEEQINSHEVVAKIDLENNLIKSVKNKIKAAGLCDGKLDEVLDNPSLFILELTHQDKNWRVELTPNKSAADDIWVEIFNELRGDPSSRSHVCSQELVYSQFVVDKIKELCQCEMCHK